MAPRPWAGAAPPSVRGSWAAWAAAAPWAGAADSPAAPSAAGVAEIIGSFVRCRRRLRARSCSSSSLSRAASSSSAATTGGSLGSGVSSAGGALGTASRVAGAGVLTTGAIAGSAGVGVGSASRPVHAAVPSASAKPVRFTIGVLDEARSRGAERLRAASASPLFFPRLIARLPGGTNRSWCLARSSKTPG